MSQQPSQSSPYAHELEQILAALHAPEGEQEQALPEEEEPSNTIHVYPVEGGGVLFSSVPLEQDEPDTTIDNQPSDVRPRFTSPRPPHFLSFVLLLVLFLLLDAANSQVVALLTPTVTIALTPAVHSLSLQGTATLGKLLSPITLTQVQTVPTTGHGHQDARAATGTLTFYNTAFTAQTVSAGTVVTGQDGSAVITEQTVTLPPNMPPVDGQATSTAHAVTTGARGNIPALDMNQSLSSTLYVKNLAAFSGGQDARDFLVVTKHDRDSTVVSLRARVAASMTSALQGQLVPGETLYPQPCTPTITADHAVGDEASHLTVTVSQTCTAISYDSQQLDARATHLLAIQATQTLGTSYLLAGEAQVHVTKVAAMRIASVVALTFTCQGSYVYTFSTRDLQRLVALVAGQPRLTALHLLTNWPGVAHASISGLRDNQPLPPDLTHLQVLIIASVV